MLQPQNGGPNASAVMDNNNAQSTDARDQETGGANCQRLHTKQGVKAQQHGLDIQQGPRVASMWSVVMNSKLSLDATFTSSILGRCGSGGE